MARPGRRFHLAVFALFHIGAVLLLLHIAPILRPAPLPPHAVMTTPDATATATAWIQSRLTALYEDASVQDAFDKTFSPTCELRLNHEVHPLQGFKDDLASRRAVATHVSVAWDANLISTNDDKPKEPAVVAGAFVVTRSLPFRIRVGPAQRQTHVHFSAKIEQDANVRDGDQRRITSFYYTFVDKTPPIHFSVPHVTREGGSDGQ